MRNFFDPTGAITEITEYVGYPEHTHDNVSFYGLPHANNKERIAEIRTEYARKTTHFAYMNHCGLQSNCASFAEYLQRGVIPDMGRSPHLFAYYGDMYSYHGQHLNFGDVLAVYYLRHTEFFNGFFSSYMKHHSVYDFAAQKILDAASPDFLTTFKTSRKYMSRWKKYTREDLLHEADCPFFDNYHFLICVGYEMNESTGNLEPLFIGQGGRNKLLKQEISAGKILLPPFGNIQLGFLSRFVSEDEHIPAFIFCSKPAVY